MMLANLLSAEQIIPEMQAGERWQAIEEIINRLVEAGRISAKDKPSVLAALKQREETMSTGIGFGIAIPHASSDCVADVVAGFGRSRPGIEFDSLDNQPVHFIESSTGFSSRSTVTRSVSPGFRVSSILRTFTISALEVTGIP